MQLLHKPSALVDLWVAFTEQFHVIDTRDPLLTLFTLLHCSDWLTVCHQKPETFFRTWKWKTFLFVLPWVSGIFFASISRYTLDPTRIWVSWGYCMNAFDEPGTPLFLFWGSLIVIFSVTTTSWIIYTSASLIRFVHMTERRMDPYNLNLSSENNREKTKETTKQAILYTSELCGI